MSVKQDVGRLQVAVDDAAPVRVFNGLAHLADQRRGLAGRQRPIGQSLSEALPVDIAHREVMLAFMMAHLVNRHDARMVKIGSRLGLKVEAKDIGPVGELARQDHLERNRSVQALLPRQEDHTHAAAGDLADDLVVAERPHFSLRASAFGCGTALDRDGGPVFRGSRCRLRRRPDIVRREPGDCGSQGFVQFGMILAEVRDQWLLAPRATLTPPIEQRIDHRIARHLRLRSASVCFRRGLILRR